MIDEKIVDKILSKCIIKDITINFIYSNKEKLNNESEISEINNSVSEYLNKEYSITKGTDLYTFIEDIKLSMNPRKIKSYEDVETVYYNYRKEFKNFQYGLREQVDSLGEIYDKLDSKLRELYIPTAEEKHEIIINQIASLEKKYEDDNNQRDIILVDFGILDSSKYETCKDEYNYSLSKELLTDRICTDLEKTIDNYTNLKTSEISENIVECFSSYDDIDSLDIFYSKNDIINLLYLFKNYNKSTDRRETFLTLIHSLGRIDKAYSYLNINIRRESQEDNPSLKDRLNEKDYTSLLDNIELVKNFVYTGYCFINLLLEKENYNDGLIIKSTEENIFVNKEMQDREKIRNEDIIDFVDYMNLTGNETLSLITLNRYNRVMENKVFDDQDYSKIKNNQNKEKESKLKDGIRESLLSVLGRDNGSYIYNIMSKLRSGSEEINMRESILEMELRNNSALSKFYKLMRSSENRSKGFFNFYIDFLKDNKYLSITE